MKLIYQVEDKPKFNQLIVFALQQLLAIMTATLVVPVITYRKCCKSRHKYSQRLLHTARLPQ